MKTISIACGLLVLLLAAGLVPGCSDDDPTEPGGGSEPQLTNVPEIPVPTSPTEVLPEKSELYAVGMSNELPDFTPLVSQIRMMQDDGSLAWITVNRRLTLACADVLPENTCNPAVTTERTYITARPRLLHRRYWRKLRQVTLDAGNTSHDYQVTVTSGTSTTHEESREFSQTMGVEVSVGGGWGPFSASVTASYEQTETLGELDSVTLSEESSVTETYSVQSDPDHAIMFAIWQLVDTFTLVDADTMSIDTSETLTHVQIPAVQSIEFPNHDVIYQSITHFD